MAKAQVKVKNYKSRRRMQRDMSRMLGDGWRVAQQSGGFSGLATPFLFRKRMTVTYARERR